MNSRLFGLRVLWKYHYFFCQWHKYFTLQKSCSDVTFRPSPLQAAPRCGHTCAALQRTTVLLCCLQSGSVLKEGQPSSTVLGGAALSSKTIINDRIRRTPPSYIYMVCTTCDVPSWSFCLATAVLSYICTSLFRSPAPPPFRPPSNSCLRWHRRRCLVTKPTRLPSVPRTPGVCPLPRTP